MQMRFERLRHQSMSEKIRHACDKSQVGTVRYACDNHTCDHMRRISHLFIWIMRVITHLCKR